MTATLVLQSCAPQPPAWIRRCMASVQAWCKDRGHGYRAVGDELFESIAPELRAKTAAQPVIATDLARLRLLQRARADGHATVVWLDADVLIFEPARFVLPEAPCAVGREVWVQHDARGRLKVYKKVHNALLMSRRGDSFLDFYADSAERLLRLSDGPMPPQFIGPKLLTALHNVVQLPVMETAGMLSPLVIGDLLAGGGDALAAFEAQSPEPIAGANLCSSSVARGELCEAQMLALIEQLASACA